MTTENIAKNQTTVKRIRDLAPGDVIIDGERKLHVIGASRGLVFMSHHGKEVLGWLIDYTWNGKAAWMQEPASMEVEIAA